MLPLKKPFDLLSAHKDLLEKATKKEEKKIEKEREETYREEEKPRFNQHDLNEI